MNKQKILVAVAHPDDEVLGAGGTLARHVAQGDDVHVLFLTDGVSARGVADTAADRRKAAAMGAAKVLGTRPPRFLSFPDNRLDGVERLDVVQALESVIAEVMPSIIYTHHAGDLNVDHQVCHHAILTACRPVAASSIRSIYAMEVASSTEWSSLSGAATFVPTRFVDISATWAAKCAALAAYSEEMRAFPHPRSKEALEALARWRGATAGLNLAEAFITLREIEKT